MLSYHKLISVEYLVVRRTVDCTSAMRSVHAAENQLRRHMIGEIASKAHSRMLKSSAPRRPLMMSKNGNRMEIMPRRTQEDAENSVEEEIEVGNSLRFLGVERSSDRVQQLLSE